MSNTIALSIEVSLGTLGLLDIGSVGDLFQVQTSGGVFTTHFWATTKNHEAWSNLGLSP